MDTPDTCIVREMIRPFDPISSDAEDQYDAAVRRLNRVRARIDLLNSEFRHLENQFVEGDLQVLTGPRKGQQLSKVGRKRRLTRLIEIGAEIGQLRDEERFCVDALARMNEALDRWARGTYGS